MQLASLHNLNKISSQSQAERYIIFGMETATPDARHQEYINDFTALVELEVNRQRISGEVGAVALVEFYVYMVNNRFVPGENNGQTA